MSSVLDDLRFAARSLRKSPGFTTIAIATLALGLGANAAIFSFVNGILLKPLPYPEPDRILRVLESPPGGGRNGISTLNFLDWKNQNTVFSGLAARTGAGMSIGDGAAPVQVGGERVTADFFHVLGLRAALGRTFSADEDQPGHDKVAVLGWSFWQSQFGGDPHIVGRTIRVDGEPRTVIGVLGRDNPFERSWQKLWVPLVFTPDRMTRDFHWFWAIGRLKPGVTLQQAQTQLTSIAIRIAHDYPNSNKGWGVGLDPLADTIVGDELRRSLYVLLAAVGMILLIACANLANLSLMRVVGREREIAIRLALGAGRTTLARLFLTESLFLSLVGGALGLGVGHLLVLALKAGMPPFALPAEADVTLDLRVLGFAFGLTLLTGALIGLFPALQASKPNLIEAMKQGAAGSGTGAAHHRVRSGLVVAEIALAFVLLAGAGLLIRSLDRLRHVDPGFDSHNVLTFSLPVPESRFADGEGLTAYLRQVDARLRALPGVKNVALTSALPMRGWGYGMPFLIAGTPDVDRANRKACFFKMVGPDYFRTLGIAVQRGRPLAETDLHGGAPVMVINAAMAKKYFPDQDPLGKRILIQEIVPGKPQLGNEIPWEVVGVVANEKVGGLGDKDEDNPGVYVTTAQSPTFFTAVVMRTAVDPLSLREPVQKAIHELSADQVVDDVKTLDAIKDESLSNDRFYTLLLGSFAGLALLLSAIGIYGVISYSVTQRTREIGIRAALGADRASILGLVLRRGMLLAVLGLGVGLAAALGLTRLMAAELYGIGERDPLTLATVAIVLAAVALAACWFPARRATRVDPLVALREE